ncbi:serine hydrolase [Amycolatopsis australiensis]|uniref:Dipeptidyl aminopeptidase/acylaminoacyl peptidase n=1 Tax=Amycolatopsis australiensis TaxID=546364 RepID=A0A1K1S601_9PSEU|nr:serine hydrolase [Amycolatopsis australiensis]SFW79642.1 Dipeptidyl aminopeptidase/acylaminoacyl peptidase [Amycolatopsis australiensis]
MTRRLGLDDLYTLEFPEQPAISPDGTRIVYVLRTADRDRDEDTRSLWQVPAAGDGEARRLTRGTADVAPAFAPDGTRLAFLRAQDGPAQLWLLPADGGEPEQVTTLPLGAGTPVWRPDGAEIAFSAPVDLAADEGEDDSARARRASAPVVADRLDFKADGAGLLRTLRKHVHVLDVATGEVRQVTSGDWHAGDPAWSPDGTRLAFPAARDADADLTFRSGVYVLEPGDRTAEPRLAGSGEGMAGPVTWTADGAAVLVVGRRDTAAGHTGLLRVPVDGGETADLAASLDRNVMPGGPGYPGALPQLAGSTVLFCVRDRGCTHLYAVGSGGGEPRRVAGENGTAVAGLSVAGNTAAIVLATPTSYGEIATVDLTGGAVAVRTAHSPADIELFRHEEREFTVSDGTVVHGWLLRDPAVTGPRPLLLDIHGGPHNAWNGTADAVHLYHQRLAAQGWAVLLLNPRGSDGYGEAFYTAAIGAWGLADAKDFLEPLDQLVAEGVADARRLAVAGYSYGGYMTCYLTSRDDRFAAAVAGGVVSDVVSMAGTSDSGHYLGVGELGAVPAENRAHYAALSPLAQVEKVRTPTLVVHGAADDRCPAGQAEQWFTALREQGVPTRLVLYPGASHLFILDGKPSHRMDFNRRILDWVGRYAGEPGKPARVPLDVAHWRRRLAELARKHRVPGATLGILRGDDQVVASCGVLNKATGVEVTDDSVFQIGSITKVWTATVAMQLVDEGLLRLDAPIADVLPELRLADPDVTKKVTLRHLLTHTSGIDGDVFTDTGRGDDCVEKYVEVLDQAAQTHPLGATLSYCNSGFVLAGRVIEKLTGKTWDAALRERLFTPLGLTRTGTLPEEALLFRAAMGHVAAGDEQPQPAPAWGLPRSAGPAGLITASAADVLAFARLHLTGGLGPDGTRLLSAESAAAMTAEQAEMPDKHTLGDSWGLGWIRFGWDGHRLIGHDGNTIGQSAFLRVLPEQEMAVTLLTNGGSAHDLYEELYREIFAELAGVAMPRPLEPPAAPPAVDVAEYLGVYERESMRIEILTREGKLRIRQTVTGSLAELVPDPTTEDELVPIAPGHFAHRPAGMRGWVSVTFYTLPTGERYLHTGVRATPKVKD